MIDAYLDGGFVPRNDTNRTVTVEGSTDLINPGLWDPDEILRVDIYQNLTAGQHTVIIGTTYGNKDQEIFSS